LPLQRRHRDRSRSGPSRRLLHRACHPAPGGGRSGPWRARRAPERLHRDRRRRKPLQRPVLAHFPSRQACPLGL